MTSLSSDRPSGQTPTEAGRELDAEIAVKVMGWLCVHEPVSLTREEEIAINREEFKKEYGQDAPPTWEGEFYGDGDYPRRKCIKCGMEGDGLYAHGPRHLSPYSTQIGAAWKVVEEMVRRGWIVDVQNRAVVMWACHVHFPAPDYRKVFETEATAPLAICRAALKALENQP